MKIRSFDKTVLDELILQISKGTLIPIIGSGFTYHCPTANHGSVPSGEELKKHMCDYLSNSPLDVPLADLEKKSFSEIALLFESEDGMPEDERRRYIKKNFLMLIFQKLKQIFYNCPGLGYSP